MAVLGLIEGLASLMVIVYYGWRADVALLVEATATAPPDWVDDALRDYDEYVYPLTEILTDPVAVVESLAQTASDTYEKEGGTYAASYVITDIVVGKMLSDIAKIDGPKVYKRIDLESIFKNGRVSIDDLRANPHVFSGKTAEEIADALRKAGYEVKIKKSAKSKSGAQIIKVNNPGGGKNISQVQVSPGGGRHGELPYVKISTTDQGKIKVIDGSKDFYKTDGKETATIIFSGGN